MDDRRRPSRRARRRVQRDRSARTEAVIGAACGFILAFLAVAQYLATGKVSDAIVGGLVTLCLTGLGRYGDLRAQRYEDDDD